MRSGTSWEKKAKHCNPLEPMDGPFGDQWDHVAIDVPSRFVVSMVTDKRTSEALREVIRDFAERTGGKAPKFIVTDDNAAYEPVLKEQYGEVEIVKRKDGQPDRRFNPRCTWPEGVVYATVSKTYKKGRAVKVQRKQVHGTEAELAEALGKSKASNKVNTAFIERQNGTDRTHNSRKGRKTLSFSKERLYHLAVGWWVMFCYNFHFLNRGLDTKVGFEHLRGRWKLAHQTPAMARAVAEEPWSVGRIVFTQLSNIPSPLEVEPSYFKRWNNHLSLSAHNRDP